MSRQISEEKFEDDIVAALTSAAGGDIVAEAPAPYGLVSPGGYQARDWKSDYDRERCLIPGDVFDFVYATQPREWQKYEVQYKTDAKEKFLQRLTSEIKSRGTLDVLRWGVKDVGCHFRLVYFPPVSGLNPDLVKLCNCNVFSVVRQLHYSTTTEQSLDLGIFVNGLPVFTAELKNPLNGQNVQDAVKQYRFDRSPKDPLLSRGRCLAHFAIDPDLVMVAAELRGPDTRFLPFNLGYNDGAGNPPVPPTQAAQGRYATAFLWEQIWSRSSVLNLLQHFIHEFEVLNGKGKKTGKKQLIFPRYHQLDSVRRLIAHAREHGAGQRYLIQHSAGSGKSNSIAWLAHQLSSLHGAGDKPVFDSVVVVTDRRVLDSQLQRTIRQFEQTLGTVENIDQTSRQLKDALEDGKKIIVTTLQKFGVLSEQMVTLSGKNFAVIVDEAHSSQSGENAKHLKEALTESDLAAAADAEKEEPESLEDRILREIGSRGPQAHISHFAFTATPKQKTLELFGTEQPNGKFLPFSLYSMRQAIEEGFILDVLENYTTYHTYFRLLKKIEGDPKYDRKKAAYLLKSFVDLHPHAIEKKISIMAEHFHEAVAAGIGGKAKAMIVTRSRLHAVRYYLELRRYLEEKGYPYGALVAFSGTVNDGGSEFTEANLNGVSESQTAETFKQPENRFLVVANKFQTGFDEPLLAAMYVDKQLQGVNAVQTLSRLNRTMEGKLTTFVLDFANEAEAIRESFDPYYQRTLLSEATDPNQLYTLEQQLTGFGVFEPSEVEAFAEQFFVPKVEQAALYAVLDPSVKRFEELPKDEQDDFRQKLSEFGRLYSFLSQVVTFTDVELEKLHVFARSLRRLLPVNREELPREIQEKIDLASLRIGETSKGRIGLTGQSADLDPVKPKPTIGSAESEEEALSRIIEEMNDRFGLECTDEDKLTIERVFTELVRDGSLDAAVRSNTRDNALLTFEHMFKDRWQEIIDSNFNLYKRTTDEPPIFRALLEQLFDRLVLGKREVTQVIAEGESQTVEFKSSLRHPLEGERSADLEKKLNLASLKTIAAFLNTAGGDLLIGVADDGTVLGLDADGFESDDKYVRHVSQLVASALGDSAATLVDPRIQIVDGRKVCMVACSRSKTGVFFTWKNMNKSKDGDFFVRQGALTKRLPEAEIESYLAGR